jgi:hypothetical protein
MFLELGNESKRHSPRGGAVTVVDLVMGVLSKLLHKRDEKEERWRF